jgi:hypothetical protein
MLAMFQTDFGPQLSLEQLGGEWQPRLRKRWCLTRSMQVDGAAEVCTAIPEGPKTSWCYRPRRVQIRSACAPVKRQQKMAALGVVFQRPLSTPTSPARPFFAA